MLSSPPSKIHEPLVIGVSPRPTDQRQRLETAKHEGRGGAPDPVAPALDLREVLAEVADPRKRRGIHHGLVAVLTATVRAVAAGR
jgi:hypothetical protein